MSGQTTVLIEELELGDDLFSVEVQVDYDAQKGLPGDRENPPEPGEVDVTGVEIIQVLDENGEVKIGEGRFHEYANEFFRLRRAGIFDDRFYDAACESASDSGYEDEGPDEDW